MKVYTDGSSLKNSKTSHGGWACLFVFDNEDQKPILRSNYLQGSNNLNELMAISYAFWYSINKLKIHDEDIEIISDSEYSIKVLTGKYKARANLNLIQKIKSMMDELEKLNCKISFRHIEAHTGKSDLDYKYNDIVDKEARRQAKTQGSEIKK